MTETPEPFEDTPPTGVIMVESVIVDGQHFPAGTVTPYADESQVPATLTHLIWRGEQPQDSDEPVSGFREGKVYVLDPDGRTGRAARRTAAQMNAIAMEKDWAAENLIQPLDPSVRKILEEEFDASIARQKMQREYDAAAVEGAYRMAEAEAQSKVLPRFVRRGSVYRSVEDPKVKLKAGEIVYVHREGSGAWESVGITDADAQLPPQEIVL